jgi:hypothetical protein
MVNEDLLSSVLAAAGESVTAGDAVNVVSTMDSSSSDSAVTDVALSPLSEFVNEVRLSDTEDVAEFVKVKLAEGPNAETLDSLYFMDTNVA